MLVLTRMEDESIIIPDLNIKIMLVHATEGRARIGIEAPKGINIIREELLDDNKPWVNRAVVKKSPK